jgi:hypothetical protein
MDIIISLIVGVILFSLGVNLGWYLREKAAERIVNNILKEMENTPTQDEEFINIIIEKHNDTYYVYGKDDNSFLGQAPSRNELEKILGDRFPGKRFMADTANLKEVGFK